MEKLYAVIYDGMDNDGYLGAMIAKEFLYTGKEVRMIPLGRDRKVMTNSAKDGGVTTGKDLELDSLKGHYVVMVDISLDKSRMDEIFRLTRNFDCYDHHQLQDDLINMPYMHHDTDRCGTSGLWYSYFTENNLLVDLVEYRDLFTKTHKDTDQMYIALNNASYDEILEVLKDNSLIPYLLNKYETEWLEYKCKIDTFVKKGQTMKWMFPIDNKLKIHDVIITHDIPDEFVSDVGYICSRLPDVDFYMNIKEEDTNTTSFSMRSDGRSIVEIAKTHGGGGHPAACGFATKTPIKTIREIHEDVGETSLTKWLYDDIKLPTSGGICATCLVITSYFKVTY